MQPGSMFILLGWVIPLACIALAVAALMSLGQARGTQREFFTWLAIILVAPVLGPALWFVVGRDRASTPDQG